MLRTAALVLAALMLTGLTGCTASYVYVRADGRDFAEDQALYQQFETDRMTCQSEGHSGNIPSNAAYHSTGDVGGNARDCMGKKGYTVVQSDVAELKRQDLAAKAADPTLMRLLVAHGADPKLVSKDHTTAVMAAAGIGFWPAESPGSESESLEAVQLAVELGGDVNAVNDAGYTAMQLSRDVPWFTL